MNELTAQEAREIAAATVKNEELDAIFDKIRKAAENGFNWCDASWDISDAMVAKLETLGYEVPYNNDYTIKW